MATAVFKKAVKSRKKFRIALDGPAGSGKTYTALALACALGQRVCLIDTERGSASMYADLFDFDTFEPETHHPRQYIDAIKSAAQAGYDVIIVDSLSHAWCGKDGALELVDKAAKKTTSGNSFAAWRDVTPLHNELVDTILTSPAHIICTMRSKMEYILEEVTRNGKTSKVPTKVGMAPVQRDGVEYEFDLICDLNLNHDLSVSKSRLASVDGMVVNRPGADFAGHLIEWLKSGVEETPKSQVTPTKDVENSPASGASEPVKSAETSATSNRPEIASEQIWAQIGALGVDNNWLLFDIYKWASNQFGCLVEDVRQVITVEQAREIYAHVAAHKLEKKAS